MQSRRSPATAKTWKHRHLTVPFASGGDGMRVAVLADTHSNPHPATFELIAAFDPAFMLHAGDIGDLAVLDRLARIAPVHAVRGNIDGHADGLPDSLRLDLVAGEERLLSIYMTHIAVYGPRLNTATRAAALHDEADLVVCGHSHVPLLVRDRGIPVFNPGSCGPRRFQLPILFGTMELGDEGTRLQHVCCETGSRWRPPP